MTSPILDGMTPDHLKVRSGKLVIDSIEVMADIGFHDFEVGTPQRLLVSAEIWIDELTRPPARDDKASAWNYDFVVEEIRRIATERRFNLQETLAHALFDRLAQARGVEAIRIRTVKPDVYPDAAGVGVEIASFTGPTPVKRGSSAMK
ncbi:dihydroneopterin aldolase [Sphingomonas sp. ASV193]|uniref:dihydroneopterin aldolase n=1 Tax=Sphingomonas sp. ASV193 TaxID=3144405 RepID=UPI0032E87DB3